MVRSNLAARAAPQAELSWCSGCQFPGWEVGQACVRARRERPARTADAPHSWPHMHHQGLRQRSVAWSIPSGRASCAANAAAAAALVVIRPAGEHGFKGRAPTCWPSSAGLSAMPTTTPASTPASVNSSRGSRARQARQEAQPGAGDSRRSSCGLLGLSGGKPGGAPPSWGLPSSRAAWGSSWEPDWLQCGTRGVWAQAAMMWGSGRMRVWQLRLWGPQAGERARGTHPDIAASTQTKKGSLPSCWTGWCHKQDATMKARQQCKHAEVSMNEHPKASRVERHASAHLGPSPAAMRRLPRTLCVGSTPVLPVLPPCHCSAADTSEALPPPRAFSGDDCRALAAEPGRLLPLLDAMACSLIPAADKFRPSGNPLSRLETQQADRQQQGLPQISEQLIEAPCMQALEGRELSGSCSAGSASPPSRRNPRPILMYTNPHN